MCRRKHAACPLIYPCGAPSPGGRSHYGDGPLECCTSHVGNPRYRVPGPSVPAGTMIGLSRSARAGAARLRGRATSLPIISSHW